MNCTRCRQVFVVAGLAGTLALTGACHRPAAEVREPTLGTNLIGSLTIVEKDLPPTDLTKVPPKDLARHIEAIYRLKPDRRLLYAVSEVHRLLGGRQETMFLRHAEGGGWLVRLGSEKVGKLPEMPTFDDGLTLVRTWAAQEWKKRGPRGEAEPSAVATLSKKVWHSSGLDLWQVMDHANRLAAETPDDPALMRVAAEALLAQDVETVDTMEILDPVLGRAMALLVLSECSSSAPDDQRDLSVLAWQLGYESKGLDLASRLPEGDPWRLFLNRDASRLEMLATSSKDPFVTVLAMRMFGILGDREGVLRVAAAAGMMQPPSFPLLETLVDMQDFRLQPEAGDRLVAAAFHLVVETSLPDGREARPSFFARVARLWSKARHQGPGPEGSIESRLDDFEAAVTSQAGHLDGPMVDRVAFASLLRAPLYSALLSEANYYFDQAGSTPAAQGWVRKITDPPAGTAAELKRWAEDRIALRNAVPGATDRISRDIATLRALGAWPIARIVYSVQLGRRSLDDPVARRPVRAMFDGLDSRPAHLVIASQTAHDLLYDLKRYQRFVTAAVQRAPGAVWSAYLSFVLENVNDTALMWRIADRRDLPTGTRATALLHLLDADPKRTDAILTRLRGLEEQAAPESSAGLLENLVWVLDKAGRRAEANKELDSWLQTRGPAAGLGYFRVVAFKAGRLRREGHLQQAWKVIQPALGSWKDDCLVEGATVLLELRRYGQAMEIARAAADRYPEGGSNHALVAGVLWRQGRDREAAAYLKSVSQQISAADWGDYVASTFVREFDKRKRSQVREAIDELEAAGVDHERLRMFGVGIGEKGAHRLAFEVLSAILGNDQAGRNALFLAFRELEQAEGRDAALAWLHQRTPVLDNTAVARAYQVGADDLLWGYPGERSSLQLSFAARILQAAAWARAPHPNAARRARILEECSHHPAASWDSVYPRYLVRDVGDDAVLAFAKDLNTICNVAWLIGTRKASEGDFAAADDWFQVAMETAQQGLPPYSYSYELSLKWIRTGKSLERVQADRVLFF